MRGWGAEANTVDRSEFDPNRSHPLHNNWNSHSQPHQHPLPLHPGISREAFQRHVSDGLSGGSASGPGPGYQPGGNGGRGDRGPGNWADRAMFQASQPGRGGRGGHGGRGKQYGEPASRRYSGDERPRGVIHAVELGRNGGAGSWAEEMDDADRPALNIIGGAPKSEGEGAYEEPTMANDPKQTDHGVNAATITTQPMQDKPSWAGEVENSEARPAVSPARKYDPLDPWRSEPPSGHPPSQTWNNPPPHPYRNSQNQNASRSRTPYNGPAKREEYKAVIRIKKESLEDEEKPAFARAKEKEKIREDDGWGVAGSQVEDEKAKIDKADQEDQNQTVDEKADQEDQNQTVDEKAEEWGVLGAGDQESGRGPMESNSKLFGPASNSVAAQPHDSEHPSITEAEAGHVLQGDVARRIPDTGWGKRGRGTGRMSLSASRSSKQENDDKGDSTPAANPVESPVQIEDTTPKALNMLLDANDVSASIAVEPSERSGIIATPTSRAETPVQYQPNSAFSAHTRLLTTAINDLRPPIQEIGTQQLKRVGHKQDRADYVADWKRSQANELGQEPKDWDEKSMSSESASRAPSRKGRGVTKAPPVTDGGGIAVVVALPRPSQRRLVDSGRKSARDDLKQEESSVASGMSGYEAQPDEDPATVIRGTSFDGIWDTVPIDPSEDVPLKEARSEQDTAEPNEAGSARSSHSESKIVVRLPTPKSSPLPSLAGSDHVPSPLIKMAVLEITKEPLEGEIVDAGSNLNDSILGLQSVLPVAMIPPDVLDPGDVVKILPEVLQRSEVPIGEHSRIASSDTETPTLRPSTYPSSEINKNAVSAPTFIPRSRSSLGSFPQEKVIIPLDDLSDVGSASEETPGTSIRKSTVALPDISPVPPYDYSHRSPSVPVFTRQPGVRSAVIPERHLPDSSPERSRCAPLVYPNEMLLQQHHGSSRYHHRMSDDPIARKQQIQPGPTKWELKMENLLHNLSSRQMQQESSNQEIRLLRQEVTSLQQHLQEARHRAYAAQTAVAEKQSHVEQLSTRIGESARTAQMYEGSLAARNADLAYCRGRIEHLESILLANQKFIGDLQAKVSEMSHPKKGDKGDETRGIRTIVDRIENSQRQSLDQGKKSEQSVMELLRKLQQTLQSAKGEDVDQARKHENQAASLKERGLQLDVREANFQLTQAEAERDYYKRLAKQFHEQLQEQKSKPCTVFDVDPDQPGFIETTHNPEYPASPPGPYNAPPRFGMPDTPPKSTQDLRKLLK